MQLRSFQETVIVGVPFVLHEFVEVPSGRRRAARGVLRRYDHTEALAWIEQSAKPSAAFEEAPHRHA